MRTGLWGPVASQQVIWHLQNYMCIGVSLSLKGAFSCAQWAPEPQLSVLDLYDNIYEIQNVIHSLFTVKLINVTFKTRNIWLVKLHVCTLPPDSQGRLFLCAAGPQAPLLSNQISVIHGSRINYETICCPQFCTYSYQILCHVGGTSPPTWHKIW